METLLKLDPLEAALGRPQEVQEEVRIAVDSRVGRTPDNQDAADVDRVRERNQGGRMGSQSRDSRGPVAPRSKVDARLDSGRNPDREEPADAAEPGSAVLDGDESDPEFVERGNRDVAGAHADWASAVAVAPEDRAERGCESESKGEGPKKKTPDRFLGRLHCFLGRLHCPGFEVETAGTGPFETDSEGLVRSRCSWNRVAGTAVGTLAETAVGTPAAWLQSGTLRGRENLEGEWRGIVYEKRIIGTWNLL